MATPKEISEAVTKHFEKIAAASKAADTHWGQIAKHIEKTTGKFESGFLKAVGTFTGLGPTIKGMGGAIADALSGGTKHLDSLAAEIEAITEKMRGVNDPGQGKAMQMQIDAIGVRMGKLKTLTDEVGTILKSKWAVAAMMFAGELALAFRYSKQINEALIQTNAAYANRSDLARKIAKVQAATGNEMQDMVKAGAALANYGFELRDGFSDTLTTMVKMEEGLGVSYETSAQMAVAVRRIGGNFHSVAESVARIKADTALTADEATRYATQISKAVMLLKPGSGGLVDQTTDYISRVAGALKELTGDGKGFVDMMAGFSTEAGMMGAATLGATPDFLSDPAQAKEVTGRFVAYVNRQLAGTSGFQRMATIQLLSDQFNTSADVIANANEMMKKYDETLKDTTSLEAQWRMQTSELHKTLSKMYNSLAAVIQQTLIPAIRILNPMLEEVTWALQWVTKSGAALYIGYGLLAFSAAGAIVTVHKLTAALLRFTGVGGIASAGGGGPMGMLGTWLPKMSSGLGLIAKGVGGIGAAAAAGWMAGRAIDHTLKAMGVDISKMMMNTRKDTYRSAMLDAGGGTITRDQMLRQVGSMAAAGQNADVIRAYIAKNIDNIEGMNSSEGGKGATKEFRENAIRGIMEGFGGVLNREAARVISTTLTDQTDLDKARVEKAYRVSEEIAKNTAFQNQLLQKVEKSREYVDQKRAILREAYEDEERLRRQSTDNANRAWQGMGGMMPR